MIRQTLVSLSFIATFMFAGQASALVITSGGIAAADGSGLTTAQSGAIVETFDGPGLVQDWSWTHSGNLHIVSGSSSGFYAAPFGNNTSYYSAADTASGFAQVAFGGVYDYLGLYWGSVDTYNTLQLILEGNIVATILGLDILPPADGFQGDGGSTYVNITGVTFDTAKFLTTQFAFEFDNLAVANINVPAPATLPLMVAGLLLAGFVARRRSMRASSAA